MELRDDLYTQPRTRARVESRYAGLLTGPCGRSLRDLARELGLSYDTVYRDMQVLKANGRVDVWREGRAGFVFRLKPYALPRGRGRGHG